MRLRRAAQALLCLFGMACSPTPYGRVSVGQPPWCPTGMKAPELPGDVRRTEPITDPLAPTEFFSPSSIHLPAVCLRDSSPESSPCRAVLRRSENTLAQLAEPVLPRQTEKYSAIRILYDQDYRARPRVVIRVVQQGSAVLLVAKVLETHEANNEGRLMWTRTRSLTLRDWDRILHEVGSQQLWNAATFSERQLAGATRCLHPVCHVVELVRGTEQRVVRDCPCQGASTTRALADLLMKFADCQS